MSSNRRRPHSFSATDELWEQVKEEAAQYGTSVSSVIIEALAAHFQSKVVRRSSWDTDDEAGWYDESRFYTFSQDKQGHSAKAEINIPKNVAAEVAGIVDSRAFPQLRTIQDFYRNAIRHWAYRTGKMLNNGSVIEAVHLMTIQDQIATDQAETQETLALIATVEESIEAAIGLGHISFAEHRLKFLWDASSSVSERFRAEYIETLKDLQTKVRKAKTKTTEPVLDQSSSTKKDVELAPPRRRGKTSRD